MAEAASAAVAQSFLTVQVGDERFALPTSDVAEVIRPPAVTRVPLGPSSLLGVANLRGCGDAGGVAASPSGAGA